MVSWCLYEQIFYVLNTFYDELRLLLKIGYSIFF